MTVENFGETHNVAITILVDNRTDIGTSTDTVKYFTDKPLLAEHGFAALVELKAAGKCILLDTGTTGIPLRHNAQNMGIDLSTLDTIVLSHGHGDHTGAVKELIEMMDLRPRPRQWPAGTSLQEIQQWVEGRRISVIIHPAAFRERWRINTDGTRRGPSMPPLRAAWEAAGANVITTDQPYMLAPGCWTTGTIPRLDFERANIPASWFYRDNDTFKRDTVDDDQAIVINVKEKGLIILAGCAHSGIVSTVTYAQEISGESRVWAIIGGFHLVQASNEQIQRTIAAIAELKPVLIAPTHCTGFKAISHFASALPEAFTLGIVGTTYLF